MKKLLVEAESTAMASGNNFRVRQLKKEIDVLLDRNLLCGLNGQDYYGQGMGIGIQSISIAV